MKYNTFVIRDAKKPNFDTALLKLLQLKVPENHFMLYEYNENYNHTKVLTHIEWYYLKEVQSFFAQQM